MNEHPPVNRAGAAVVGLLAGGVGGFVLTEGLAVFSRLVLDHTLDVEHTPWLLAVFAGVPLLAAVAGALVGLRAANRSHRDEGSRRP